jgi:glutathione S-transferase
MSAKPLKIYGVPLSVHTRKVIVAARLKSIAIEVVPVAPVAPDSLPANWRSISPTGLIPAIDDGGFVLADSTAILHYLERKVPEPRLLPADLQGYGQALFLDAWAGSALFRSIVHPIFINQVVEPNLRQQPGDKAAIQTALNVALPEAFGYLEGRLSGAFLVGDHPTIADLAVVSNLITFQYLGHRVDTARYPKLAAYLHRHLDSQPVAEALKAERPVVAGFGLDHSFLT